MPSLLLSRPDRVGDVIIATACLEPIRRQRPDWRLVFAAREVMRPLLEGHPLLDQFVVLPKPETGARGRKDLADQLRAAELDVAVHLHPDASCQRAARAAGISRRIGYRSGWLLDRWTLTDPQADRRRAGEMHEGQYNFGLLAPLGIEAPPLDALCASLHLDPRWRDTLLVKLAAMGWEQPWPSSSGAGDYLVINPTAFSLALRWPPDRFVSLARALRQEFGRVVMVGEQSDDPSIAEIRRQLTGSWFVDLAGKTNLAELGWLLRHARLLVSRNTGTAHLATAVGCPLVELFGRLEGIYGPTRWRALGEKTRRVTVPADVLRQRGESKRAYWQRCHASIPQEEVVTAAREVVASLSPAPIQTIRTTRME